MPVRSLGDEVLSGGAAIAKATGLTRRQVFHHAAAGRLPVYRVGRTLFARRASLDEWRAECEAEARRSGVRR